MRVVRFRAFAQRHTAVRRVAVRRQLSDISVKLKFKERKSAAARHTSL